MSSSKTTEQDPSLSLEIRCSHVYSIKISLLDFVISFLTSRLLKGLCLHFPHFLLVLFSTVIIFWSETPFFLGWVFSGSCLLTQIIENMG